MFQLLTRSKNWTGAALTAALVLSHWIGDLIVHRPDLIVTDAAHKAGLGLWNTVWVSYPLEIVITLGALVFYAAKTKPSTAHARLWIGSFAALMVILQTATTFGPIPKSMTEVAISGLAVFSVLAFLASRLERTRTVKIAR